MLKLTLQRFDLWFLSKLFTCWGLTRILCTSSITHLVKFICKLIINMLRYLAAAYSMPFDCPTYWQLQSGYAHTLEIESIIKYKICTKAANNDWRALGKQIVQRPKWAANWRHLRNHENKQSRAGQSPPLAISRVEGGPPQCAAACVLLLCHN